jgi:hypothetical protein
MNSPAMNSRLRRTMTANSSNPTKLASDEVILEQEVAGDTGLLASVPSRFGRMGLFRSAAVDDVVEEDCTPTDEDITETDHVESPRSVRRVAPSAEPSQQSLLTLSELIERLSLVSNQAEDDSNNVNNEKALHRKRLQLLASVSKSREKSNPLTIEEMTRILAHVNLCDASQVHDLAQEYLNEREQLEMTGKRNHMVQCSAADKRIRQTDTEEEWKEIEDDEEESAPSFYCDVSRHGGLDDNDDEESIPSFYCDATRDDVVKNAASEEGSLCLTQLWDSVGDEASGIWLDPTSHSCDSSVTWYEGINIEEIDVSSDEEELREILLADTMSAYEDEEDSVRPGSACSSSYVDEIADSITF